MRKIIALILLSIFFSGVCAADALAEPAGQEAAEPAFRALLIGCDDFLSEEDTTPIAATNTGSMNTVLSRDLRGWQIYVQNGILNSRASLQWAIESAFAGACESDVSLLYISTHGEFDTSFNNPEGALLFSDGSMEEWVSAGGLQSMLDRIPGRKVLIVDACHSGALIRKGVSPDVGESRVSLCFSQPEYHVLVSSGASERSWYWVTSGSGAPLGSSNFTGALAAGLGLYGEYTADLNADGVITLGECRTRLLESQASSTAHLSPQGDDFPLLVYDVRAERADGSPLREVEFGQNALDPTNPLLTFSFLAEETRTVGLRLTAYLADTGWDWNGAVTVDTALIGSRDEEGRMLCRLTLDEFLPPDWTYVMAHLVVTDSGSLTLLDSCLLRRVPAGGDPELSIRTRTVWRTALIPELSVFVAHAFPVPLSASVYDESGRIVRSLCRYAWSRPEGLTPSGTLLYWDGLDAAGAPVPAGTYTVRVRAWAGTSLYHSEAAVTLVR